MKPYATYYADKCVLVTGGAGAIGSNLVQQLIACGTKKIIVLDNLSSAYLWNIPSNEAVRFVKGDIRNEDDLRRVFHFRPQVIFHLAAFFANQNSVDYPLICDAVNSAATIKLLEYAVLSGCVERFVYTNSEGGAYGSDSALPYQEKSISYQLSSPYYISKMSGEAYCNFYRQHYNLPVSILRLFNSYGPGEVPGQYRNVIPNFIFWAMQGKPLPLTGNDKMARDFVYVNDTVEGILRAGYYAEAIGHPINIASGQTYPIVELAKKINELTNNKAGTRLLKQRKWDTRNEIYGDNQRCSDLLQYKPSTSFDIGLAATFDWFQKNWDLITASAEFSPGMNPALDVA